MKKLFLLILLFLFCTQAPGQKYLLPITLDASNGLPIRDGTFAIYDSTGTTKDQDLYWLSAGYYYYTSSITAGWYDIKQQVSGTWYTHLDNIWLMNTYTFINDSVMYYINVDGTEITKTNDTLRVGTIDSSDIAVQGVSMGDIWYGSANTEQVLFFDANGVHWDSLDGVAVNYGTIPLNRLVSSSMNLGGSGLTDLTNLTFGASYSGLNVNVDGSEIVISNDTLKIGTIPIDSLSYSSFYLDGSGLTGASNITFGQSYPSVNVNVDGSTITITSDTLGVGNIDSTNITDGTINNGDLQNSSMNFIPHAMISVNTSYGEGQNVSLGGTVTLGFQFDSLTTSGGEPPDTLFMWYEGFAYYLLKR